MSQRPGWLSALLVIGVANLAPLAGWWWNRTGQPLAAVELGERELGVHWGGEENTSVWLQFRTGDNWEDRARAGWADSASLRALGFEPERLVTGETVELLPRAPGRRPAWVLLRVDEDGSEEGMSRLEPVAVGPDPDALYRRAGDRATHLVMRGVVRVGRQMVPADFPDGLVLEETWTAGLDLVTPVVLHVPRSLVPLLERLAPARTAGEPSRYLVRVEVGRLHLPRIEAILPTAP